MIRGVSVGKFLPPHLGHKYLIDSASAQCDELTVLVANHPEYLIPIKRRLEWLRKIHPNVRFIAVTDKVDDNDSPGWAKLTIDALGFVPDIVFTSESYGKRWAEAMKTKSVLIDQPRKTVPISATKVRTDPWKNWQYLHPIVRQYFARRICLVGAESSGTTTLSKALAEYYDTDWVREYGRDYTIQNKERLDKDGWQTKDFVKIAKTQNRLEDKAAQNCNKLFFCDTDSFATSIWHERYMELRSWEVEKLAADRHYDLYFLTDPSIPFEQDGIRDGEHLREWMHKRFIEKLTFWGRPFVVIEGSPEQRLKQATAIIDRIVSGNTVDIPGLIRNAWHGNNGF